MPMRMRYQSRVPSLSAIDLSPLCPARPPPSFTAILFHDPLLVPAHQRRQHNDTARCRQHDQCHIPEEKIFDLTDPRIPSRRIQRINHRHDKKVYGKNPPAKPRMESRILLYTLLITFYPVQLVCSILSAMIIVWLWFFRVKWRKSFSIVSLHYPPPVVGRATWPSML